MSDPKPRLRVVPAVAPPVSAERKSSVRFTSASGLIARVHKPLNSFRWVGPAKLSFGEHGVLVTAKRATLLGLRQTQRFIAPAEIRDVYREANVVQVHLRGSRNPYFRLWADDSASAAQIVALLPTRHTFEFESAVHEPEIPAGWRLPPVGWVVLFVVVSLGFLAWVAGHRRLAVQEQGAAQLPRPQPQSAAPIAKPATRPSGEDALLADQDLMKFGARIQALTTEFAMAFEALMDGRVSQEKFADELDQWLRPQWDDLEARVRRTGAPAGSLRERADHDLMAAINNWQLALYAYADDLRNQRQVVRTFEYLKRAEQYQQRARQMQSDLERPTADSR